VSEPHFAVSAVGVDRPGIVAAVTRVLVDQGCNLEDTSMSILRGHFAMMLLVAGPGGLSADALEGALAATAQEFDLVLAVRAIDDTVPIPLQGETWTVSVYGADRPGIVHRVTQLLADAGANVVDLTTRVIGDADRPLYAMLLDITLPAGLEGTELRGRFDALAGELGVDCSMHPADADVL
jgi:glycine cleavage system transcriptional repressor